MTIPVSKCLFHDGNAFDQQLPWSHGLDIASRANARIMGALTQLVVCALDDQDPNILEKANRLSIDWDGTDVRLPVLGTDTFQNDLLKLTTEFTESGFPIPIWLHVTNAINEIVALLQPRWRVGYLSVANARFEPLGGTGLAPVLSGDPVVLSSHSSRNGELELQEFLNANSWGGNNRFTMAKAYSDVASSGNVPPEGFWVYACPGKTPFLCFHHEMIQLRLSEKGIECPEQFLVNCAGHDSTCTLSVPMTGRDRFCLEFLGKWLPSDTQSQTAFSKLYLKAFRDLLSNNKSNNFHTVFFPVAFRTYSDGETYCANISMGIVGDEFNVVLANYFNLLCRQMLAGIGQFTSGQIIVSDRMAKLRRSKSLLEHLRRPLAALSKAFDTVQIESQEMRSILNDPEDVIFGSHHLIADIFDSSRPIRLTKSLTIKGKHEWGTSNETIDLQVAYVAMLARIFGVSTELSDVDSKESYLDMERIVLRRVSQQGIHQDLVDVLRSVLDFKGSIEDAYAQAKGENKSAHKARLSSGIGRIKQIAFTPFKLHGYGLPYAAVKFAANRSLLVDADWHQHKKLSLVNLSPISPNGILSFITSVSHYEGNHGPILIQEVTLETQINPLKCKSIRLDLSEELISNDAVGELRRVVTATANSGVIGRQFGDTFGLFQGLLRHSMNVVAKMDDETANNVWLLNHEVKSDETLLRLSFYCDGQISGDKFEVLQRGKSLSVSWSESK